MEPYKNDGPSSALNDLASKIANINASINQLETPGRANITSPSNAPDSDVNADIHNPPPIVTSGGLNDDDVIPLDPSLTDPVPPDATTPTTANKQNAAASAAAPGSTSRKRRVELIDAFEEFRAESPDGPSRGKSSHRTLQPFKKGKHKSIIEVKILRAISQFVADFDLNVKQCEIDEYLGFKQRTSRRARTTKTKSELVLEGKLARHPRADNARKDVRRAKALEKLKQAGEAGLPTDGGEGAVVGPMYADATGTTDLQMQDQDDDGHDEEPVEDYSTMRALFERHPMQ